MSQFRYYRPSQMPPVVKNLIIINALVFVAQQVIKQPINVSDAFGLYPIMPDPLRRILEEQMRGGYFGFYPFQIATHMFAHGGFMHILFNMFALWTFGKMLENVWGPKRFLGFYLACGVGAALCHLAIQSWRCYELWAVFQVNPAEAGNLLDAVYPAVGASGAVMGIFAAFAYLFPNTELFLMFIPVPVKAKWMVLLMAAYDLFGGLGYMGGTGIAHFAHLGGALTGFILVLVWQKTNRRGFY